MKRRSHKTFKVGHFSFSFLILGTFSTSLAQVDVHNVAHVGTWQINSILILSQNLYLLSWSFLFFVMNSLILSYFCKEKKKVFFYRWTFYFFYTNTRPTFCHSTFFFAESIFHHTLPFFVTWTHYFSSVQIVLYQQNQGTEDAQ